MTCPINRPYIFPDPIVMRIPYGMPDLADYIAMRQQYDALLRRFIINSLGRYPQDEAVMRRR
jgi:hypothetical protein